jgi:hypothetical protein
MKTAPSWPVSWTPAWARERELAEAGEQASKALGRAIAEIRAALGEEDAA